MESLIRIIRGRGDNSVVKRSTTQKIVKKRVSTRLLHHVHPTSTSPPFPLPLHAWQWLYAHTLAQAALSPVSVLGGALGRQGTVQAVPPSTFPSSLFSGLASVGAAADPGFSSAVQTL
jgi:hypothetical protein